MDITLGKGITDEGPGLDINLTGDEVATAIRTYLMAHDINIDGPSTVRINGRLAASGKVYIDPSGSIFTGGKKLSGRIDKPIVLNTVSDYCCKVCGEGFKDYPSLYLHYYEQHN